MWGITGRGARLGDGRRTGRMLTTGMARIAVRGPVEHAVLDIAGELDFSSVDDAYDVISMLPHRISSIDLRSLEFVDGAGARLIERVRTDRAELHGDRPSIIGATPHVERTIRFVRARDRQLTPSR